MRLGLRGRLVLGSTLQVVAFVGAAMGVHAMLTARLAEEQIEQAIVDARASLFIQMRTHLNSSCRETRELARSPMLQWLVKSDAAEGAFADVLQNLEAPVVAVLDAKGKVLASRGAWPTGTDLGELPGLQQALQGTEVGDHVWQLPAGPALVAVAPLVRGDELLGALVRGERIDHPLARRIAGTTASDVVLLHEGTVLGARWQDNPDSEADLEPLRQLRRATLPDEGAMLDLTIDGKQRFGLAMPLHREAGIIFLAQDLRGIEAMREHAQRWLLACGLVMALAGALFAFHTAARLSQPLRALTSASDRMGRGDLGARVGEVNTDDELGRLARSFDAMAATVQRLVADVTDKAARAEAATRAKDGFLTSISHELRTPLTGIQSTAELLLHFGDDATTKERTEFLGTILRETERLGRRISDALEFANLSGGKAKWTIGRVELRRACEQACRRIDSLLVLKRVTFQVTCGEEAVLQGDREHVTQAIRHLVQNAWQWSPADGVVDITVRAVYQGFSVEVADHGPGIARQDRKRIFDAFTQGGDVLVDKPAGMGIGLKIAAEVAAVHGGGIEYSERTGGGACFYLLLRCEDRPIDRLATPAQGEPALQSGGEAAAGGGWNAKDSSSAAPSAMPVGQTNSAS